MLIGYEQGIDLESNRVLNTDLKRAFRAFDATFSLFHMLLHLDELIYVLDVKEQKAATPHAHREQFARHLPRRVRV